MKRPALLTMLMAVGCGSDANLPSTTPETTTTASVFAAPTPLVRIMPLGDSITQGDSDHDTYRRPLWMSLQADGYRVDFVGSSRVNHRGPPPRDDFDRDHEGHWGWRTDEILEHLAEWVETAEPDVLLVHLGSNDVFQNETTESTVEELGELIDIVRGLRPKAKFLLAQIIPTDMADANRGIRALNARIPELARSKSTGTSPVIVVNQFAGFDAASLTYDGVHPNPAGEIHLSDRWLEGLVGVLSR